MKNIILLLMISVLLIAFISCTSGDIPNIPDFVAAISTTYDNDTQMEAFLDNKKEITILKEKTEEGDFQERWKKIIQKDMSNNPLTEEYYRYNTIYLKRDYEYGGMQEGTRESDKPTQVLFKDSQGNIAEKELYE